MIPQRLFDILGSCAVPATARFPPTEIFNEGWMLRLILDAVHRLDIADHPLHLTPDAGWFSEVRLSTPFKPRMQGDKLAEGFTHADAVIGHFEFRPETKAGLHLKPGCRQFVVIEAKMFSNLSVGTTNARNYNQAARNIACMAEAIAQSGMGVGDIEDVGFFVVAPSLELRSHRNTNLEACMTPTSIRGAVHERIKAYEAASRPEAVALRDWEAKWFSPFLTRLVEAARVEVLSWEDCIESIRLVDSATGDELGQFYRHCLELA